MKNILLIVGLLAFPFFISAQALKGMSQDQYIHAVTGINTKGVGVYGEGLGAGVMGKNVGNWYGVYGESPNYTAVGGQSTNASGVGGVSTKWFGVYGESAQFEGVRGVAKSRDHGGVVGIGANVGVYGKSEDPNGIAIQSDGRMTTKVLEILGGSDIAEHFKVSENESKIDAGTLMVIDEKNAGSVVPSELANDRKVVGVVSGAGGVKAGMTLRQEGILEGNAVIAVAGRVYVKANDLSGAIQPGDFLTSSSVKGEAMKVSNFLEAQGAIIGKAMTPIQNGYVLMLISLQ